MRWSFSANRRVIESVMLAFLADPFRMMCESISHDVSVQELNERLTA